MFNREMVKRKSPFEKKIGLTIFLVQDKVNFWSKTKLDLENFHQFFLCKKP